MSALMRDSPLSLSLSYREVRRKAGKLITLLFVSRVVIIKIINCKLFISMRNRVIDYDL